MDKLIQELEWTAESLNSAIYEENPNTTGYKISQEEYKLYNLINKLQEIQNEKV